MESTLIAGAVRQPECTLRDEGKKSQQSPSIPPFAGSTNVVTLDCTIASSGPEISPAPLDDGHRVPPVSPPREAGSVVPLTPKSPQGVGSKLLSLPWQWKTTSQHHSYTEVF